MSPIQLIDEDGKNLGEIETKKALKMAKERDLDLVEVAPNAHPPVCKIMSWSKFKYDLSKKKKSSSKSKNPELKEMRFSPSTAEGDINHKLKRVRYFLKNKHPVRLTIFVRGRIRREAVKEQMQNILNKLEGKYETDQNPRRRGRNLTITIFPANN